MEPEEFVKLLFVFVAALFLFVSGVNCGSERQMESDARESINARPGSDWIKAVIEARAWRQELHLPQ